MDNDTKDTICNKLVAPKAILQMLTKGECVSKKFATLALAELNKAIEILRDCRCKN